MLLGRLIASLLVALLPVLALAQAPYVLTPAAAEKFVRATQQMVAGGAAPKMQGGANPLDLSRVQAEIDRNPAAQAALSGAGLTSSEYVAFMGAAMAATMVGQMEAAGMRGMLPPGIPARPPQPNIDFMKGNMDLFQRSMTPGAPTAATGGGARAAANTSDVALPMPNLGTVWPSTLLARITRLDKITDATDCSLGGLQATITAETNRVRALQSANYGNPGDRGLARTPAEGAVLERAGETEIEACGNPMSFYNPPGFAEAEAAREQALNQIALDEQSAWNACPGIAGGKDAACERAVNASTAQKVHDVERRFLAAVAQPFADQVTRMTECTAKREAIARDAQTANVRGANVQDALRPLLLAWEQVPFLTSQWNGICEDAQRRLRE